MNNIEFQEWLKQFPDDVVIECVYHTRGGGYYDQGGNASVVEFNPGENQYGYCANGHFVYSEYSGGTLRIGGHDE